MVKYIVYAFLVANPSNIRAGNISIKLSEVAVLLVWTDTLPYTSDMIVLLFIYDLMPESCNGSLLFLFLSETESVYITLVGLELCWPD